MMQRQYYIDTIRALNIFLLTLYHSGLVFSPQGWFIENPVKSTLLGDLTHSPIVLIPMPLLMFLAGATTWYSFQKRTTGQYIRERFTRILLPLALGIAIVIPPHMYAERLFRGRFTGTFIEFYPKFYTEGIVPEGHFTYRHLWFLAYLFVLSLIALPIFGLINRQRGRLARFFSRPGAIFLPLIPMILIEIWLRADWPTTLNILADWANVLLYLQLLIWGYVLVSDEAIQARVRHIAPPLMVITIGLMTIVSNFLTQDQLFGFVECSDSYYLAACVLRSVIIWGGLLSVMGVGMIWNNHAPSLSTERGSGGEVLRYAKEISYLYYIFHQTVIVLLAYYFIIGWHAPIGVKFITLVVATAVICVLLCEIIRRVPYVGQLFGMRR